MTHRDERPHNHPEEPGAPRPQYHGQAWPPPDDEISLFDLWDSLVRRRWIIIGVAALVTLLAAAYAMTRPDVYRYQSSIRLGVIVMEGDAEYGESRREPIVSPEAAQAQLESSIIPAALRQVLGLDEEQLAAGNAGIPDVQVTAPEGASIVHLAIEGPEEVSSRYLDILHAATSALVRDHADILQTERIRLTRQLDRLDRTEERVASRLEETRSRIDRLTTTDGAAESAVAIRIDGLQQRMGELEDRILEVQTERDLANDYLATIKEYAEPFTGEMDADTLVQQQEAANRITAMSGGIRPTTVISPPDRSLTQVGTSGTLILALGMVLGGMLGIFAAFIAEFITAARRRHQPADDTGTIEHQA